MSYPCVFRLVAQEVEDTNTILGVKKIEELDKPEAVIRVSGSMNFVFLTMSLPFAFSGGKVNHCFGAIDRSKALPVLQYQFVGCGGWESSNIDIGS